MSDTNKALLKLLLFIAPVAIVVLFFEYNLFRMPNSYNFKKNLIEKNAPDIEMLILGSSHSYNGINPVFLSQKSINMAESSQSLYYDLKITEKYLDRMKNLKTVIIPVSYFSLGYNINDNDGYWRGYFYEKYYGIACQQHKLDIKRFSFLALYGQITGLIYAKENFDPGLAKNITDLGFDRQSSETNYIDEERAKKQTVYHATLIKEKNIPENIKYLETLIEKLQSKNVRPVLVTTPVYHTYSDNIDKKNYDLMQKNVNDLVKKYNIKYFNYFTDNRFIDKDFITSDHLNEMGAEKFSKILDKDILH